MPAIEEGARLTYFDKNKIDALLTKPTTDSYRSR